MATWTNIPDSVLEPGKPARSVDALALRDNPIAIAQGAAGAPRVQTGGLANNAVTNEKIANMDAGKLNTGTVPGARLPMTQNAVGTYALVTPITEGPSNYAPGATVAGSNLTSGGPAGFIQVQGSAEFPFGISGGALPGTWRLMSGSAAKANQNTNINERQAALAIRIS